MATSARNVNVVGLRGKASIHKDLNLVEAKYLNREVAGFWTKGQWSNQDNWNSMKWN